MKTPDSSCSIFLFYILLFVLITGCRDELTFEEKSDLIASVVWGETDNTVTDPEKEFHYYEERKAG